MRRFVPLALAASALVLAACSGTDDVECTSNDRCALGLSCVGGICVRVDGGVGDTDVDLPDADVGEDADIGGDTEVGVDADTGVDVEVGVDADAGLDAEVGVDADAGVDTDAGEDADAATGVSCVDDTPCGPLYLCDTDAGFCFDTCTDGSECAVGAQCELPGGADEGACVELPAEPYTFVYVTSEVPWWLDEVQDTSTPGPDIDGVTLARGDTLIDRPTLEDGTVGAFDRNDLNRVSDGINVDAMTGEPPTFACNVSAGFVSLGASDGFMAYSFGLDELLEGDVIAVFELDATSCPDDVRSSWVDTYGVLIGRGTVPRTASQARAGGCWQAAVVGGGWAEVTLDIASCDDAAHGLPCETDDECAGGTTCDTAVNRCHASCTEVGAECAPGYVCEGADDGAGVRGTCETVPVYYDIVAVYSDTDSESVILAGSDMPGPDLDYVEVVRAGVGEGPADVDGAQWGDPSFFPAIEVNNVWDDPFAVLVRDGMVGEEAPYECDLADTAGFFSLGAFDEVGTSFDDGYIALSFGLAGGINDGDIIRVWEASHESCANISTERLEPYSVYVESSVDRSVECDLGSSGEFGGISEFTFDRASCP